MKMFEAEKIMNQCVEWIRSYFAENALYRVRRAR